MQPHERRAHARIAFPSRVTVEARGTVERLAARDISRGGIFLYTTQPPGNVGDAVRVMIAMPHDGSLLTLEGEIVRIIEAPTSQGGGVLGIGIQWAHPTKEVGEALDVLLEQLLASTGGGKRAHPRISALLRVVCHDPKELKAMARDIGRGGLKLETDRRLTLGDQVELELVAPNGKSTALKGTVRRLDEPAPGHLHPEVGLEFDELSESEKSQLAALMKGLLKKK
jgi:Tfp pilus assembly protein PilZ